MVYFELGRCPMYIQRKLRIFKYWCSLLKTDNCILQACYKQLFCEYEKQQGNCTNWASKVRNFILWVLGITGNNKKFAMSSIFHSLWNSILQMHLYTVALVFLKNPPIVKKLSKNSVYKNILRNDCQMWKNLCCVNIEFVHIP